ncbi:metal-dependent transcriptional regulator [Cytophaga aurantiaca]|uniref:metal-dependent transcriptional regulator n=1 Tax=Cytophaga aurantiaca TaxID=29530 RepID=UPI0003697AEA|nr:metal-dependent transcriptional regulator [Cytophaga aurantiaca]
MSSHIEENYLKAIYKQTERNKDGAYTNDIANELNVKAATVTEAFKKLGDKGLIFYEKYKAVTLTDQGRAVAVKTIRKHRLWEVFLVEKLGFKWDEIHPMAEELEHVNFEELTERLAKFLGNPEFDPHGDPIPDKNGKFAQNKSVKLTAINIGKTVAMTGIENHTPSFLQHLDKLGLKLGAEITIKDVVEFDQSILVSVNNKKEFYLSQEIANNILCK